jgi:aminomethyltransferase
MAVRKQAGLFDVSHMGEVMYSGPDAKANVNKVITMMWTFWKTEISATARFCNHDGGFVDDCIVYKYNPDKYMIVINASNRHKDVAWFKEQLFGDVVFEDISDITAEVALQGPNSTAILEKLVAETDIPRGYYTFKENVLHNGIPCLISQTGYTGETGYEIYTSNDQITAVWNKLLEAGKTWV